MATSPDATGAAIPPTRKALEEALPLAEVILRNIELADAPLATVALKTARLARLLNDFDIQKTMQFEAAGYPCSDGFVPAEAWNLAIAAGRGYEERDKKTKELRPFIYIESIEALEAQARCAELVLSKIVDTPKRANDFLSDAQINRSAQQQVLTQTANRLASSRSFIHSYVVRRYYELHFSGIASDIFSRVRQRVDKTIAGAIPDAAQRLTAIYDNLQSENPEDWSNAVHGCRRILMDLADFVFPATTEERTVQTDGGKTKTVKLQQGSYINRIMAFVQDNGKSQRFSDVVGSHLAFLGNRLDALVDAANKGTHDTIVTKEEADRYVVYTYLVVGDILSLVS